MTSAWILSCVLLAPQIEVRPFPAVVGEVATLRFDMPTGPVVGAQIELENEDGTRIVLGATGADGRLQFTPKTVGHHVCATRVGDVRHVAPLSVVPPRRRLWWGLATVPLGFALLWSAFSRARGRRGP